MPGTPGACALAAPAKLNLGLRVTGRRPDGYHELESLFLPIAFADHLRVEQHDAAPGVRKVRFTLAGGTPDVRADATNLAARAARAFLEAADLSATLDVHLLKRVPGAAGLGGGSSDAAAVLRALVRLFPGALAQGALAAVGLRLGADVPFFLQEPPRAAWVRGVGERVEPLPHGLPDLSILLVHPGIPLSTKAVFEAFDAQEASLTPPGAASTMRSPSGLRDLVDLGEHLRNGLLANDLEPAASRLCPPIARLKALLRDSAAPGVGTPLGIGMSGSGPTLFALFEARAAAEAARARLVLEAPARAWVTGGYEPAVRGSQGIHGASPNW